MWLPRLVACLLVLVPSLRAEEAAPPAEEAKRPAVVKIGEHRYRLGQIEFDARTRELFLPVTVNMREGGPIEYMLVHEAGKVHEAIFVTAVSPMNLQIAMKLLKFETGLGDVFNPMLPEELIESEGGKPEDRGALVEFTFREDGKEEETPVARFILDGRNSRTMPEGPWIFTGSAADGGHFMAEVEGSVIAIYLDRLAMFNTDREGSDDDERWGAHGEAIPPIGTRGTLKIRPAEQSAAN